MSWSKVEDGVWISHQGQEPLHAVVGGMHGDEVMGARVIDSLLEVSPSHLPHCCLLVKGNPEALHSGTRGTSPGVDLNRAFAPGGSSGGEYENERAHVLRRVLQPVRRLLDLHQTHCKTPPLAVVRMGEEHLAEVARLGLEYAVVGVEKIYAGAMLSDWVDRNGGLGITVETGMADTAEAFEMGRLVAERFLGIKDYDPAEAVEVFEVEQIIRAPFSDGIWKKDVGNGTVVRANEELVRKGEQVVLSPGDGVLLLPHEGVQQGSPLAVFARVKASYQLGAHSVQE